MTLWEKVKKDLQKGLKEGIEAVKEGAQAVKEKAEEIGEEGKRRYTIFDLKGNVEKQMAELGGRVYDLSPMVKNPMIDPKVKAIISKIKKLEAQIASLEGKPKAAAKKTIKK